MGSQAWQKGWLATCSDPKKDDRYVDGQAARDVVLPLQT